MTFKVPAINQPLNPKMAKESAGRRETHFNVNLMRLTFKYRIIDMANNILYGAISKLGFWFKVKADPSFNLQAY